jgi:hypothetical protein
MHSSADRLHLPSRSTLVLIVGFWGFPKEVRGRSFLEMLIQVISATVYVLLLF